MFTSDDKGVVAMGFDAIVTYNAKDGSVIDKLDSKSAFSGDYPRFKTSFSALSRSSKYAAIWQGNLEHDETLDWKPNIWVVVWDIAKKAIIGRQEKLQSVYKNCSGVFTPDERTVLLGSLDGIVREWSVLEQRTVKKWQAYGIGAPQQKDDEDTSPFPLDAMSFSPDGKYLATVGLEPKIFFVVKIFDYPKNNLIHAFENVVAGSLAQCHGYPMAFSPDSKYFAMEKRGQLCLYDTQTWKEKWCVYSYPEDRGR